MDYSYTKPTSEVLKEFEVTIKDGLNKKQVKENTEKFGRNELPSDPETSLFELIIEQFKDQLVIILLFAAAISFVLAFFEESEEDKLTAYVEPLVILLILIANAIVGVIQESNAEKAIEALKEYTPDEAKVIRNGIVSKIPSEELVPGDIISLASGDKVPADCRLVEVSSSSFKVDQSILTGESIAVSKDADVVVKDKKAIKQDQINILFSGTSVAIGKGYAVVVKTGSNTAIGDIHQNITNQISEKTPLKKQLDDFGDQLAKIITIICILVWLININHFTDPTFHGNWLRGAVYYFKIAVALAVAAIPEGLSAVITTCLSLGTKKMAAEGAIVRRLNSVETLGCTSVICSDKTGTLTTNQMSVKNVFTINNEQGKADEYTIGGSTYRPRGDVKKNGSKQENPIKYNTALKELSVIASLCNEAKIVYNADHDSFTNVGEPTEAALTVLVEKLGTDSDNLSTVDEKVKSCSFINDSIQSQYEKLITFEFSRDRKSMSVLAKSKSTGNKDLFVKGAPEQILERCTTVFTEQSGIVNLTQNIKSIILKKIDEWAEDGLRVLAFAVIKNSDIDPNSKIDPKNFSTYESNMTFVGLTGMMDPPRKEVLDSIKKCKEAGIRVIVITGDNKKTAESICKQIGIFEPEEDISKKSYTGREFDELSEEEKKKVVLTANLFSRVEPLHKQELVDLLKSQGFIVAMTGDGVNDAPALKKADIGVSMGSGTDVAKLASDMVLADDNFATIVKAVEEGRSIYNNTKQFIRYLISSNIGEVVSIFLTVLLGMPEALIPVQLLWVNLVTDGLPATALGFNKPDHAIMKTPPRNSKEPLVTTWLYIRYVIIGLYVGFATVFGYAWWFMFYSQGPHISYSQLTNFHKCSTLFPEIGCEMFSNSMSQHATTISLSVLVVIEMLNSFNSLSENESLLTLPIYTNITLCGAVLLSIILHLCILYIPFFSKIFVIVPLDFEEWMGVLAISVPVIIIDEILKFISRNYVSKKPQYVEHYKKE
ncbi:Ca-transporting ATPase [Neocallimastix californiae]|jgi:Ca2+ transporting ATPase|uniref:Calcium-transporting ATPase n=1 Tax=Neocallimastix californiae TaxID=1754190 RepID=A0A1Y2EN55_9FUNG|nr:Ca-transporting ATPase [Neocallimastix californiae]|eukprot:ORY72275.1 Ca-transporting ATPase [Neocallimastix californiae]